MNRLETALRAASLLACLTVALAALALGWAATTRTTPAGHGVVYRENLLTGRGAFCDPTACIEGPRVDGPADDGRRPDFSARAKPAAPQ